MEQQPISSSSHIPWHPAFVQALKLELEEYKDALEFSSEYQLNAEPLKIDLLIVKKAPELVIEKNIAQVFKRVNILEYKSPEDYFSVSDFYKVISYTYLYAALNRTDVRDMTVSLIGTRYPRGLFSYFREGNCVVSRTSSGIYAVSGYPVVIQVVESRKLPLEDNLWLKGLSDDLNVETAAIILEESRKRKREAELGSYIYALLRANAKTIEEVSQMKNKKVTLEEVLEKIGLTAEWEKRGESRGKQTGWEEVIGLLKQGYTVDQLERMNPGEPAPSGNVP